MYSWEGMGVKDVIGLDSVGGWISTGRKWRDTRLALEPGSLVGTGREVWNVPDVMRMNLIDEDEKGRRRGEPQLIWISLSLLMGATIQYISRPVWSANGDIPSGGNGAVYVRYT